ncbi:NAD(P)/FAD-dependent oxidoreductase [Actinoplanes sp. NPDC023801]|uniref:flavin-containing monooxygenase n=1 Tax=Actinoplanes sp. NPDC023801 TaxID=3154595 RepID=UPI0033D1E3D1
MAQTTDVLVVGAGISGINVAHRVRQARPDLTVRILEARDAMAGTWDLFRYPGVRSDSDFFTLAFPFRPWRGADSIVGGDRIRDYIADTARETGIDRLITYNTRVTAANWSTAESRWQVSTGNGEHSARFLVFCAGYYDYDDPHDPEIKGEFGGQLVHPQFWPAGLDHRGRRVVVIGSGATAVTIVPAMDRDAAHVTMLQRTPTYVLAQPRRDVVADVLRRVLPAGPAHRAARAKNITMQWLLYRACRRFPDRMRALLRKGVVAGTGSEAVADRDFAPPYALWDQRLCIVPDGDLLSGLPNLGVCIGYINLSWTVRSDMTARLLARILRHMGEHGRTVVEPVAPAHLGETFPFMDMQSGYLRRAAHLMPRATARYPWAIRQDVMADARATNRADLMNGLVYR